jgi:hypothetical protein
MTYRQTAISSRPRSNDNRRHINVVSCKRTRECVGRPGLPASVRQAVFIFELQPMTVFKRDSNTKCATTHAEALVKNVPSAACMLLVPGDRLSAASKSRLRHAFNQPCLAPSGLTKIYTITKPNYTRVSAPLISTSPLQCTTGEKIYLMDRYCSDSILSNHHRIRGGESIVRS